MLTLLKCKATVEAVFIHDMFLQRMFCCVILFYLFSTSKSCNYCTSQTVDSIIENGRAIYQNVTPAKYAFISDFLKKLGVGRWPCKSYS